jgi:hypothetical protein
MRGPLGTKKHPIALGQRTIPILSRGKMNIVIWVLQIILCIKFLSVAYSHGMQRNNPKMDQSIDKLGNYGFLLHRIGAAVSFLGSIGILIPAIIGMDNSITVVSSIILAVVTMLSIVFHIRSREKPILIADIILTLLAAFVAYGRWIVSPL